jgi:hypothetical protein
VNTGFDVKVETGCGRSWEVIVREAVFTSRKHGFGKRRRPGKIRVRSIRVNDWLISLEDAYSSGNHF